MKRNFYLWQVFLLVIAAFLPVKTFGQIIYSNSFAGTPAGCPTSGNSLVLAEHATGTTLSRQTMTCSSTAGFFNSTTLNNTAAVNEDSYIEFSVGADPGYQLNITSLSFFRQGSNAAPNRIEVRYSTDNFVSSTDWETAPVSVAAPGAVTNWDFDDFVSAAGGKVTFRIYPYGTGRASGSGNAASNSTFRLNDIIVNGTVSGVLPVRLVAFSGGPAGNGILLQWTTAWEELNKGFLIEKSTDAVNFKGMGYVNGRISTESKSDYRFTDTDVQTGKVYYFRLKQEDISGAFAFSGIIAVRFSKDTDTADFVFPNPNKGSFKLTTGGDNIENIRLYDSSGREVPVNARQAEHPGAWIVQTSTGIKPGIYFVRLHTSNGLPESKTLKVMIE